MHSSPKKIKIVIYTIVSFHMTFFLEWKVFFTVSDFLHQEVNSKCNDTVSFNFPK